MKSTTTLPTDDSQLEQKNQNLQRINAELKEFNEALNRELEEYNQKISQTQQAINAALKKLVNIPHDRPAELKQLEPIHLDILDKKTLNTYFDTSQLQEEKTPHIQPELQVLLKNRENQEIWFLLIEKYQELTQIEILEALAPPAQTEKHDTRTWYRKVFDVVKKLVDLTDDIWGVVRNAAQTLRSNAWEYLSGILIGACGFIIHLGEGIIAFKDLWHILGEDESKQFKTRFFTNLFSFFIAGAGFAMSVMLFAHGIAEKAAGKALLEVGLFNLSTVLVPGLLFGIYGLALWRKSYILHQINKEKEKAFIQAEIHINTSIQDCLSEIQGFKKTISRLFAQLKNPKSSDEISIGVLLTPEQLKAELVKTTKNLFDEYKRFHYLETHFDELIAHRCATINEKAAEAEREVGFGLFEVIGSILVAVGILIGTTALIGGTGGAALPLIALGVGIGFFTKLFEVVNEKYEFKYTNDIRAWLFNSWLFNALGFSTVQRQHAYQRLSQSLPELEEARSNTPPPNSPPTPIDLDAALGSVQPSTNAPATSSQALAAALPPQITVRDNPLEQQPERPQTPPAASPSPPASSNHHMIDSMTTTRMNGMNGVHAHPQEVEEKEQHQPKKTEISEDDNTPTPALTRTLTPSSVTGAQ